MGPLFEIKCIILWLWQKYPPNGNKNKSQKTWTLRFLCNLYSGSAVNVPHDKIFNSLFKWNNRPGDNTVLVGLISGLIMKGLELLIGKFDHSPAFMTFEPLTKGRYWLLLVWVPYWILNILGEEFLWRGVMLPRQEIAFGKYTWLIHGFGWGLFHIAFGWQLLITIIPLIFIQSYIVQRTKNSWIGVIMHGGLNGPSFIAICFGLI